MFESSVCSGYQPNGPLNPAPNIEQACPGEDLVEAAGKMGVLDRLLDRLKARGHRVTLFSQHNRMLNIIEDFLIMRGYRCS